MIVAAKQEPSAPLSGGATTDTAPHLPRHGHCKTLGGFISLNHLTNFCNTRNTHLPVGLSTQPSSALGHGAQNHEGDTIEYSTGLPPAAWSGMSPCGFVKGGRATRTSSASFGKDDSQRQSDVEDRSWAGSTCTVSQLVTLPSCTQAVTGNRLRGTTPLSCSPPRRSCFLRGDPDVPSR